MKWKYDKRPTIGFVGLSNTGSVMVERLLDLKYEIDVLVNGSSPNIEPALKRDAIQVFNGAELAKSNHVIMTCVNATENIEKIIYESSGIKDGLKEGLTIIDFGTSKTLSTKNIPNDLKKLG